MQPNVRVLVDPVCEPVSLAQAKEWCRVESDDDSQNAVLNLLIQSARERAEDITGRAFVQRQLEVVYDGFPSEVIRLPYAPLVSVQYIDYLDSGGALVRLTGSPSQWREDTVSAPGRIQALQGASWPGTLGDAIASVRIGFTCGYASVGSPDDDDAKRAGIPASVKNWMHVRIAGFYENREALIVGGQFQQPPRDFVDGLLDSLRVDFGFA